MDTLEDGDDDKEAVLFITSTYPGDAVISTGLLQHLIDVSPLARLTFGVSEEGVHLGQLATHLLRRSGVGLVGGHQATYRWPKIMSDILAGPDVNTAKEDIVTRMSVVWRRPDVDQKRRDFAS